MLLGKNSGLRYARGVHRIQLLCCIPAINSGILNGILKNYYLQWYQTLENIAKYVQNLHAENYKTLIGDQRFKETGTFCSQRERVCMTDSSKFQ